MNNSIYITVRLDIEHCITLDWNDVKNEVISEMDYNFNYKRYVGNDEFPQTMIQIINTEICGENE
jgi:hypothetical protein